MVYYSAFLSLQLNSFSTFCIFTSFYVMCNCILFSTIASATLCQINLIDYLINELTILVLLQFILLCCGLFYCNLFHICFCPYCTIGFCSYAVFIHSTRFRYELLYHTLFHTSLFKDAIRFSYALCEFYSALPCYLLRCQFSSKRAMQNEKRRGELTRAEKIIERKIREETWMSI